MYSKSSFLKRFRLGNNLLSIRLYSFVSLAYRNLSPRSRKRRLRLSTNIGPHQVEKNMHTSINHKFRKLSADKSRRHGAANAPLQIFYSCSRLLHWRLSLNDSPLKRKIQIRESDRGLYCLILLLLLPPFPPLPPSSLS